MAVKDQRLTYKLDLDTPLEAILTLVLLISFLLSLFWGFAWLQGGQDVINMAYFPLWVILLVGSGVLRARTDNFYLLDPEKREFLYHSQFIGKPTFEIMSRFEDVFAVGLKGWFCGNDRLFALVVILSNGQTVQVSNYSPLTTLAGGSTGQKGPVVRETDETGPLPEKELLEKGEHLASVIGCRFLEKEYAPFLKERLSGADLWQRCKEIAGTAAHPSDGLARGVWDWRISYEGFEAVGPARAAFYPRVLPSTTYIFDFETQEVLRKRWYSSAMKTITGFQDIVSVASITVADGGGYKQTFLFMGLSSGQFVEVHRIHLGKNSPPALFPAKAFGDVLQKPFDTDTAALRERYAPWLPWLMRRSIWLFFAIIAAYLGLVLLVKFAILTLPYWFNIG